VDLFQDKRFQTRDEIDVETKSISTQRFTNIIDGFEVGTNS
jgi:hypothetical protein